MKSCRISMRDEKFPKNLIVATDELTKVIDGWVVLSFTAIHLKRSADLHVHRAIEWIEIPRLWTLYVWLDAVVIIRVWTFGCCEKCFRKSPDFCATKSLEKSGKRRYILLKLIYLRLLRLYFCEILFTLSISSFGSFFGGVSDFGFLFARLSGGEYSSYWNKTLL